jgi:DNA adenine methylase
MQRSFIKWVGGKYRSLSQILPKFPKKFKTYYEPFIGSAVLFFNLKPEVSILNDFEFNLVSTFRAVRDHCGDVCEELEALSNDPLTYYEVRKSFNEGASAVPARSAAQFIYMNKCGFNGLYRVNRKGAVNVSYGRRSGSPHQDYQNIRQCSDILKGTQIMNAHYEEILRLTRSEDFVYMDPPYYKEAHNSFTGYNPTPFGPEDHERLALECKFMSKRGVLFAQSNSDTEFIRNLYKQYNIYPINTTRTVSVDASVRGSVTEILITNYEVSDNAAS